MEWLDIFAGGKQVDSSGTEHDGDKLIDGALKNFDEKNKPPVVIGHPKTNSPAFGWVSGLREKIKDGKRFLQAKLDNLNEGFLNAWKAGAYKNRSAAFNPDGSLRHVGFLGGTPPAVKGLEDYQFNQPGNIFEFNENERTEKKMTFEEFKDAMKFWKSVQDDSAPKEKTETPAQFSEADIEAAKKEAAEQAAKAEREKMQAEFAAQEAEKLKTAHTEKVNAFIDGKINDGLIPPAWKEQGLGQFMLSLTESQTEFEFSEGKKQHPLEWFINWIDENFKKGSLFSEIATKETATDSQEIAEFKLGQEIAAKVGARKEG